MKSEKIIYFAYGANLTLRGMQLRCPGCQPLAVAVLHDHRLVFRGVADIETAPGSKVYGALYEIVTNHLLTLDRFEGYPRLYIRKTVTVSTEDGREIKALVYQMNNHNHYGSPSQGYLNTIISGCHQWQMPEEYIRHIITQAINPDFGVA